MKLCFVVQRYGPEVLGGSEHLCRLVAERLATAHEVDVLTTCSLDYVTWKNDYTEGSDRVRGVVVRRFATARTRDLEAFNRRSEWIYGNAHTRADELEWLAEQGPWAPGLIEFLKRNQQQYDALIFFTYLYAPTVLGLEVNPGKSILVSTAHDEPAIKLEMYTDVFSKPAAICYLTESERAFVQRQFPNRPLLEEIVGVGIDIPPRQPYPRTPAPGDDDTAGEDAPSAAEEGDDAPADQQFPSHISSRGAVFRRRHRLYGPVALYGGRIDPGKGCEELIEYFESYVKDGGDATLALMGAKMMVIPEEPYIRFAGMLSDSERSQALEAATVVVCPSPYESLSLVALEAMAVGTPVLVNARSAVLVEHCVKSNGGLYYGNREEFIECLKLLVGDGRLRAALGQNGRDYVRKNYRWDTVLGKWDRLFAKVRNAK
ncbi:MAG TPA: glycosyltransferase family 4 protein [Vicinamibacterales bacterium]|jgi:glycosyltransferase involved in cell wall biosynthesis|nr:glycosyltransferase family 4 protein [Vicinamibacterales bacterium]